MNVSGNENIEIMKCHYTELPERYFEQVIDIFLEGTVDMNYPLPGDSRDSVSAFLKNQKDAPNYHLDKFYLLDKKLDQIVTYGRIRLSLKYDQHIADLYVRTINAMQKRGYGLILVKYMLSHCDKNIDLFSAMIRQDIHPITETMINLGGKKVGNQVSSICDLTQFDIEVVRKKSTHLREKVEKMGYQICFVSDYEFRAHPDINYQEYLKMLTQIWNDIPREDSDRGDQETTEEERDFFMKRAKENQTMPWTFVVLDKNKLPIGMSETWLSKQTPTIAIEDDTGVLIEHRGNDIGLMMMYQMLEELLSDSNTSELRWWTTMNPPTQEFMNHIKSTLGFKQSSNFELYEFKREYIEKMLELRIKI